MVSKRIARLEARLGVRLLHRTTRRLALTPRGAVFHRDMVAVLAAIVEAEARVADTGDIAGPLVVNAPTSFGRLHRSEEHTSELQSLMRISYAVFCLKKKKQ